MINRSPTRQTSSRRPFIYSSSSSSSSRSIRNLSKEHLARSGNTWNVDGMPLHGMPPYTYTFPCSFAPRGSLAQPIYCTYCSVFWEVRGNWREHHTDTGRTLTVTRTQNHNRVPTMSHIHVMLFFCLFFFVRENTFLTFEQYFVNYGHEKSQLHC